MLNGSHAPQPSVSSSTPKYDRCDRYVLAKRMLGGIWDDAFVYYSRFTEAQLLPGANLLLEKLMEPGFEEQFVYKKYASKKFLKASIYARNWALRHRGPLGPAVPAAVPVASESESSH